MVAALRLALEAGLTPGEFWTATPYETRLRNEAAVERQRADYRLALWGAWHTAGFSRVKRMPRLDHMLRRMSRRRTMPQSPDEVWAAFVRLNSALGGEDRRNAEGAATDPNRAG